MPLSITIPTNKEQEHLCIGIVLPAYNEESNIADCIKSCEQFTTQGDELIVIDAASTDETAQIALQAGAKVIRQAQRQRGYAVAAGVETLLKQVDVILIAHADMRFAVDARAAISKALSENPHAIGGVLGHKIDDTHLKYRIIELGNRFRAKHCQLPYGDQAMFVRTRTIKEIGGFPQLPCMEDLELSLRCRNMGTWLYLDTPVKIDARHWRRGVVSTTIRNWSMAISYRLKRKEPAPAVQPS